MGTGTASSCAGVGTEQSITDPTGDLQNNFYPGRKVSGYATADITRATIARSATVLCLDVHTVKPASRRNGDGFTWNLRALTGGVGNSAPEIVVSFGRWHSHWLIAVSSPRIETRPLPGTVRQSGDDITLTIDRSEVPSTVSTEQFQWSVNSVVDVPHTGSEQVYDCVPNGKDPAYPPGTPPPMRPARCVL